MHRRIAILLIASALVVKVYSENVLKCYMCTSLSDENCGSGLTVHSLHPVECTLPKMIEWQRIIKQHNIPRSFAPLFEVAESLQNYRTPHHMACAKMVLYVGDQNVTVRTCQMAETEAVYPCQAMNKTLKNRMVRMEQCSLCLKEACNGTIFPSPEIFYIFLTFLGTLIYAAFYH
nr:PREDICTED: uncharacterized protein LOC105679884 [Linepithema humile]